MYLFSLVMVALTTLLLLAGGLVTSHGAGLAVPDWPLSYGQLFPPMVGNIFWEHGHRMIAGFVGISTLIFVVTLQFREKRVWLKRLAWGAFGLVVVQALLGGLTVLLLLPPAVSIAHACTAQTFYCLLVALAFFLRGPSRAEERKPVDSNPALVWLSVFLTGIIYVQLILGAAVRHTGYFVWWHAANAGVVLICALVFLRKILNAEEEKSKLRKSVQVLGFLISAQAALGIGAFIFKFILRQGLLPAGPQVWITAAHQTLGALVLAAALLVSLKMSTKS